MGFALQSFPLKRSAEPSSDTATCCICIIHPGYHKDNSYELPITYTREHMR